MSHLTFHIFALIQDLSQNVHRTSVRTPTVGVSGCVTPGGELLLPHKGRTMMGFEKLLLQGIPFTRLALGPETEVQLSDLAGNAVRLLLPFSSRKVCSLTISVRNCIADVNASCVRHNSVRNMCTSTPARANEYRKSEP